MAIRSKSSTHQFSDEILPSTTSMQCTLLSRPSTVFAPCATNESLMVQSGRKKSSIQIPPALRGYHSTLAVWEMDLLVRADGLRCARENLTKNFFTVVKARFSVVDPYSSPQQHLTENIDARLIDAYRFETVLYSGPLGSQIHYQCHSHENRGLHSCSSAALLEFVENKNHGRVRSSATSVTRHAFLQSAIS